MIETIRQLSDGAGVDLLKVVHRLEAINIELSEVRKSGEVDLLVLMLGLRDLELRGIEVLNSGSESSGCCCCCC